MTVQRVALIFGWVFLLVGVLGFVSAKTSMDADLDTAPKLLTLFPVNLLHNLVHVLFGIWGIFASRTWGNAKTFCQVGGVIYILLAVLGFLIPNGFGLIPLGGHDVWLHALLGIILAAVGFTAKEAAPAAARI